MPAFNGQVQDLAGNAVTVFQVEVRDESDNSLVAVYANREMATPLGNPFTPNPLDNGHFRFYVVAGTYRIRAFDDDGDLADWRDVQIGTPVTSLVAGGNVQLQPIDVDGTSGGITQPRIGGLWTDEPNFHPSPITGVNIARFERVLIADACGNDGTKLGGTTWLDEYDPFVVGSSELAVIAHSGRSAFVAAVRSSDNNEAMDNAIAGSFYAINDNTEFIQQAFGVYIEAFRLPGAGSTLCLEMDITDFDTAPPLNPYTENYAGVTAVVWAASGGGNEVGTTDASAAHHILNNGARFQSGIVFDRLGITGTDGVTGTGEAIALAKGHQLNWYYAGNNLGFQLWSDVAASGDVQIFHVDGNGVKFVNNADGWNFRVNNTPGTLTGNLAVYPADGTEVELAAEGSATDLDVRITPKGAGLLLSGSGIKSQSQTGGVGYAAGAGGTVTQTGSKSDAVALNRVCGTITMNAAALLAGNSVQFFVANDACEETDVVFVQYVTGSAIGGTAYEIEAYEPEDGGFAIRVLNRTGGPLSEAIQINFVIMKGANA